MVRGGSVVGWLGSRAWLGEEGGDGGGGRWFAGGFLFWRGPFIVNTCLGRVML